MILFSKTLSSGRQEKLSTALVKRKIRLEKWQNKRIFSGVKKQPISNKMQKGKK
jgi:hypothetical protein